jgi:hypothetical protein
MTGESARDTCNLDTAVISELVSQSQAVICVWKTCCSCPTVPENSMMLRAGDPLFWASDRIVRSVRHFLDVLDELSRLNVEFSGFREQIDTGGPLGRAVVVIIGAIAELERNLIIERVRAGMRRARLEPAAILRDRRAWPKPRPAGQKLPRLPHRHPPGAS